MYLLDRTRPKFTKIRIEVVVLVATVGEMSWDEAEVNVLEWSVRWVWMEF